MKFLLLSILLLGASVSYSVEPRLPFDTHQTKDKFGRSISFYVSKATQEKLPLAVSIQGSGCFSVFKRKSDGRVSGGQQNLLLKAAKESFHVLVVEKPGVRLFDNPKKPGTAINCEDEFKREHTLERWRAALHAAIEASRKLAKVDSTSLLVVGHSEGAILAAALAEKYDYVSHAAILSGSGPTQLFDHVYRAIKRSQNPQEEASNVSMVYKKFSKIKQNPKNWETLEWGHPLKRWASFLKYSTVDLLKASKAKIYVAHGTNDRAAPIEGFDVLRSELVAADKNARFERRQNADHSLNLPGQKSPEGKLEVFGNIVAWYRELSVARAKK